MLSCCGPLIQGQQRATGPLELLKARYTAFVLEQPDYLLSSWHPKTRPREVRFSPGILWLGLQILEPVVLSPDGRQGWLRYRVRFACRGQMHGFEERARYLWQGGDWFYVDGEILQLAPTVWLPPGRNAPCPCGSGHKYKRCCRQRHQE